MPNEEGPPRTEEDLEDGEIEDDDEETTSVEPQPPQELPKPEIIIQTPVKIEKSISNDKPERDRNRDRPDRSERRSRHEEKGKKHMTEAEKSILHLRKREEIQRKKWEKFNRNKDPTADPLDDDFAKNIEKTLATILNKKEKEAAAVSGSEDKEKEDDKRGKKRRKNDKDRTKNKQRRIESSPKSEIDENEMLNIRGGSPEKRHEEKMERTPSLNSEESYDSEYSSDRSRSDERVRKRDGKKKRNKEHGRDRNKNRDRDRRNEQQPLKDSQGVCVFYLQGKCQKNDCPYSHEAVPPMKLELCKFYLMDCCAKGDKCSYMHSEFPCKFYHTGLNCLQGDNCKFAHGKPLSEGLKQILFKHIETAPRDILGGFPRMSREEALNLINITQNKLQEQHGGEIKEEPKGGIPSLFDINVPVPPELLQGSDDGKCQGKNEKSGRNRPSRWQDPEPSPLKDVSFPLKPFNYGQDQDMRIRNSNGDIDMRTLPPAIATMSQPTLPIPNVTSSLSTETSPSKLDLEKYKREAGILNSPPKQDLDIRTASLLPYTTSKDVDIRQQPHLAVKDVDIRHISTIFDDKLANKTSDVDTEDEPMLQIDTGDDGNKQEASSLPLDLPKIQRELFLRIQAQQKETMVENDTKEGFEIDDNINWYSDDDDEDDNRLTIKVDNEDVKEKEEALEGMDTSDPLITPLQIKPLEVVEKLGDLSKIDISAEVTKLFNVYEPGTESISVIKETPELILPLLSSTIPAIDPRLIKQPEVSRPDPRLTVIDPRQRSRQSSTETQVKPEKVSIYEQGSIDRNAPDDIDGDFRKLHPATEIDASMNSHLPMVWKVSIVEIPHPDYTGLKLSISDAEKTGDPRLRKIFRLSIEERDTPAKPQSKS
ncbi:hypothetical protein NQ314_005558 [Rhamnusium bicolor]|uniref:C3H1-type domain-containing protein n=1 Tax=Rhamnusium bicolor TaxID=1586634 RepID=A0AAV8ZGJ5_9CUCU|nr:hypothetical protein NQ314_005558 [Rhamnusium bicolor]